MKTIIEYLEDDVRKIPDAMAVADMHGIWSYTQLDEVSSAIAAEILRFFAEKENTSPLCAYGTRCVGVIMPRKKEALAAFLGVMRSGNAYVFSAPNAPSDRLAFILSDAAIECIVTDRENLENLTLPDNIHCILIEDILNACLRGKSLTMPLPSVSGDMPAFVTYTSGSTGKPKGAIDTYYYIENHVNARHYFYTPSHEEAVGCIVSFSYAASTYDLFSGIKAGCGLYIFHEDEMLDSNVLADRIISCHVTAIFMIPSMIPVVFGSGRDLPVKCIVTAGEKMKKVPELPTKIVEIYGSSEAAAVIGREANVSDAWDLLGKPVPGVRLFLIGKDGKCCKNVGETGELAIVSDALMLGYINLPEMNSEKLVNCPFIRGEKMYLSGDLMRFDEDGNYYFCGRKDNMVKINGQRAELGEIEHAVAGFPRIRDAVCSIITRNGTDMLVCHYTVSGKEMPDEEELAAYLRTKVPAFMVPRYWICMDRFPVNINGKTDKSRLPLPRLDEYCKKILPHGFLENRLLAVARELLPDIEFGVTDDMRQLGLDSIKAVHFAAMAEKYDKRITVTRILRYGKIREMISAPKEIVWFHTEYNSYKPVLVLIHGIVPVSGYSMICDDWSEIFNVLIVGPFTDHIEEEPGCYDYELLASFYYDKVKQALPEGASLWGFAGFSFGGQLAVSLAEAWRNDTGVSLNVLMGDTLIQLMYPGKVLPYLTPDDPHILAISERGKLYGDSAVNEPLDMIIEKQNKTVKLLNTITENCKYDGPVFYLDAHQDYDPLTEQAKVAIVRSFYKNIRIFEFRDYFHNDLYLKREMLLFYRNLFCETSELKRR